MTQLVDLISSTHDVPFWVGRLGGFSSGTQAKARACSVRVCPSRDAKQFLTIDEGTTDEVGLDTVADHHSHIHLDGDERRPIKLIVGASAVEDRGEMRLPSNSDWAPCFPLEFVGNAACVI